MARTDPRVDTYIKNSAAFAQPILSHLRKLVHKACPQAEEAIKWSCPHFVYHGSMLCSMAAFKEHCTFGFWKASLLKDPKGILQVKDRHAMGNMDRITSVKDLPADKIMLDFIQQAAILNEAGVRLPPKKKSVVSEKDLEIPEQLASAFLKNKKAAATFQTLPPSHRKEYIQWINEAKTDPTREKRIRTTVELAAEGKGRYWKYDKKK